MAMSEKSKHLQRLLQERESANIAAHFLAQQMPWEEIAEVDKTLAIAVLVQRERVPMEKAFEMVGLSYALKKETP